jgi:hypothetical protein
MTVYATDGLYQFGNSLTAEVPSTPGNANDATPKAPLGALYRQGGKVWRYVKFDSGTDAVAAVAGAVVHWFNLDPPNSVFTVTTDYSHSGYDGAGTGIKNLVAGIIQSVVTTGYYTWIQVAGVATSLIDFTTISGDYVAGAVPGIMCTYGTTDKKFDAIPAGTGPDAIVYGVMTELVDVTTSSSGKVLLQNLDW